MRISKKPYQLLAQKQPFVEGDIAVKKLFRRCKDEDDFIFL